MSEAFTPLCAEDTIAAARRIHATVDRALSIRRGLEKVTDRELLSIVIFVLQLDEIARTAALACRGNAEARAALRRLLAVPGYLPTPDDQEPHHGEG